MYEHIDFRSGISKIKFSCWTPPAGFFFQEEWPCQGITPEITIIPQRDFFETFLGVKNAWSQYMSVVLHTFLKKSLPMNFKYLLWGSATMYFGQMLVLILIQPLNQTAKKLRLSIKHRPEQLGKPASCPALDLSKILVLKISKNFRQSLRKRAGTTTSFLFWNLSSCFQ